MKRELDCEVVETKAKALIQPEPLERGWSNQEVEDLHPEMTLQFPSPHLSLIQVPRWELVLVQELL